MSRQEHRTERLAVSLQALGQRLSFLVLVVIAVALLAAGRSATFPVQRVGTAISDLAAPVLELASRPVQVLRASFVDVDAFVRAVSENRRLRAEVERLQAWHGAALNLERENTHFRSLLNLQNVPQTRFVSARIISDAGSPFVRTLLINAGHTQGVREGMAVVGSDGLIGRIVLSGGQASRVLLLTDLNSRVPVSVEPGGYRAVLAGDNENLPKLSYLPAPAHIEPGSRLVTSGHGGLFPPGIPVGVVASVGNDLTGASTLVQPFADQERATFVRVLQYRLPMDISPNASPSQLPQMAHVPQSFSGIATR